MKNLRFHYQMTLRFSLPVREHRFTLKCIPLDNERQIIDKMDLDIYPNEFISRDYDSFGNHCIYGYAKGEHDRFFVDVKGEAKTGLCDSEKAGELYRLGFYKCQTDYTRPGEAMKKFHDNFNFSSSTDNVEKAVRFMKKLHEEFEYVQGVTGINTKAEMAMQTGQGVCQDYSHILLGLCRMEGIPCRYVVGMLLGEGLSHAWVEVYQSGRWIALDATNNLMVNDEHIKISSGRDYGDCNINQGVFYGGGTQVQNVTVLVEEA